MCRPPSLLRCLMVRDRRGVAALEFAMIAPVLIILLAAAANLGLMADHSLQLANAARSGAQYATILPDDPAGAHAAIRSVLPNITQSGIVRSCTCPPSATAASGGNAVECTMGTCPAGIGMARYVTVTVTMPPPSIPGIAFNTTAAGTRVVVVRVQ